ncbi:tyrosine-type recombinase/integrase [Oleiphilus sp. HI0123]|uniref:tyrosine-type recombinase/integrase n=1 Tax=Oleiphilus sp. HI0123 TaxID=1822265 RepID=UPI0018D33DAE
MRDLALFNLAIDSKLRGCDLVKLRVYDVYNGKSCKSRTQIIQKKTKIPVKFEITSKTREAILVLIEKLRLEHATYLFPSRFSHRSHISTRQYYNLVKRWVAAIGLDTRFYGTHSLRRTKVAQIKT